MKYLTRQEELILLAIFQLKDDAYLMTIRKLLKKHTGKAWTLGTVYVPLDRLRRLGYLDTRVGEATAKRGGKAKKYYRLSKLGVEALKNIQKVNDAMWVGFTEYSREA